MSNSGQASIVSCPSCGRPNRVHVAAPGAPHCGACGKPLPWLVEADQESFAAAVERSSLPVLAEFWAPWCGPCRMVAPLVERISLELAGRLKVVKINTDLASELGQRFNVHGIPTLILFEGGQVRDRVTGAPNAAELRSWIDTQLASRQPNAAG